MQEPEEFKIKDRFDLEQEILSLTNYSDQIKMVARVIIEDEYEVSNEMAVNALNGISTLLELHRDKLLDTMNQAFQLDSYN